MCQMLGQALNARVFLVAVGAHYLPMHTEAHNNISTDHDDDSDHPAIHSVTKHDFIVGLLHLIKFDHA